MINNTDIARAVKILAEKSSISICLPVNPNFDALAASTALYLGLLQLGKSAALASLYQATQQFGLTGEDKIQTTLVSDGDQLVVSFPYVDGSVDKVSYSIEGNKFSLVIQPREGYERLNPKKVSFGYTGGKPDVVVALYAPTLSALGDLYTANKDQFTGVDIINIDRHFTNANYGSINIVDKKISSLSEMVLFILKAMRVKFDKEIATNLYNGIVVSTNNFSSHTVTSDTFQAAAFLMNAGAVKKQGIGSQPRQNPVQRPIQNQSVIRSPQVSQNIETIQQDDYYMEEPSYQEAPVPQQRQLKPQIPLQQNPKQQIFEDAQDSDFGQGNGQTTESMQFDPKGVESKEPKPQSNDNPKDWLKPKIFSKNRNLI